MSVDQIFYNRLIKSVLLRRVGVSIVILMISGYMLAQIPDSFPHIGENSLTEVTILTERTFTSESLFGYMNGGAELYLEYGFDRLAVSELLVKESDFKIEIFKMHGIEESFGIYSVSVYKCDNIEQLTDHFCVSQYQVQLCLGEYYINIINNSGSSAGKELALDMAQLFTRMITSKSLVVKDYLPDYSPGFYSRVILAKGSIGLYNGATEIESLLNSYTGYTTLVGTAKDKTEVYVRFKDEVEKIEFLEFIGVESPLEVNVEIELLNDRIIKLLPDGSILVSL